MTLPNPYRGHAQPTWDTVTLKSVVDLIGGVGNPPALGGADLAGKVVARNRKTNNSGIINSYVQSGARPILETAAVTLTAGRAYQVYSPGFGVWSDATTGLIIRALITYTTNNTAPTTISTILDMSQVATLAGGNVIAVNIGKLFIPSSTITFRSLLSAYLISPGSANAYAYGAADWPIDLVVLDVGTDPGAAGAVY